MREVRDILTALAEWNDDQLVMGTVVDVAGSAYRQPGARMVLRPSGERVGLISGGCLEREVARHAFERTADGPQTLLYDTRGDRLHPQGQYGTGCDGIVHLFVERLSQSEERDAAVQALKRTWETRTTRVLVTLFEATGDFTAWIGAKTAVEEDNSGPLSIFPDSLADSLAELTSNAFEWPRPRTVYLECGDDSASFLVEPLRPPLDLLVFGAGDDVRPVADIADDLGWQVRIAGHRPAWVTRQRFPSARRIHCAPPQTLVDEVRIEPDTHALLMTHNFEADAAILPDLVACDPAFVGLLGPRRRTMRLFEELHTRGRLPEPDRLDDVQTPLGVDLGGEAPSEVALSIVSGVLAAHRDRQAGLLQDDDAMSIHAEHRRITQTIAAE